MGSVLAGASLAGRTLAVLAVAVLVAAPVGAVVALTDGRYGGRRLMHWVYDRFGPVAFAEWAEPEQWRTLAGAMGLDGESVLLDVGTATGDLPLTFAADGTVARAVGVDRSAPMIAVARRRADERDLPARFDVVDVTDGLPYEDGAFDAVVCPGLLESLSDPEAVLDDDGVLAVSRFGKGATLGAALGRSWYVDRLRGRGFGRFEPVELDRSHDGLVAFRGPGN